MNKGLFISMENENKEIAELNIHNKTLSGSQTMSDFQLIR